MSSIFLSMSMTYLATPDIRPRHSEVYAVQDGLSRNWGSLCLEFCDPASILLELGMRNTFKPQKEGLLEYWIHRHDVLLTMDPTPRQVLDELKPIRGVRENGLVNLHGK